MDSNSLINCPNVFSLPSSSRRYQSRSDLYMGDVEGEDNLKAEFICPFCTDKFDIVELCCDIDEEHLVEAKNGICPGCTKRVGGIGHCWPYYNEHSNFYGNFEPTNHSLVVSVCSKAL